MYIETVPNRNSPPTILLREGWREGGKVKKRTADGLPVHSFRTLLGDLATITKNRVVVRVRRRAVRGPHPAHRATARSPHAARRASGTFPVASLYIF